MFTAPDDCSLVKGEIDPLYTCDEWVTRPPRIYIIRHGSTAENRGGPGKDKMRGHEDIPLDPQGVREVQRSADLLAGIPLQEMYMSDLRRAVRTAEIVYQKQSPKPTKVKMLTDLRTWDIGPKFEGLLTTKANMSALEQYIHHDYRIPPGGESFKHYVDRLLGYTNRLFEEMKARKGVSIAIVTHGRSAEVIDLWIAAGCDEKCMRRDLKHELADEPDVLHPGGVACYEWNGKRWIGTEIPEGVSTPGTKMAARR